MESCNIQSDPSEVRASNPRPMRLSKYNGKLRALSLNKSQGKTFTSATKRRKFGVNDLKIDNAKVRSNKYKERGSKYRQPIDTPEVGYFRDLRDKAAGYAYLFKVGWKTIQYYQKNCAN